MRKLDNGKPAGYGPADRKLAEDLDQASTPAEQDEIAKADGHTDAAGARKWLEDRS